MAREAVCWKHMSTPMKARCRQCVKPVCAECVITGNGESFCSAECQVRFADYQLRSQESKNHGPSLLNTIVNLLFKLALLGGVLAVGVFVADRFFDVAIAKQATDYVRKMFPYVVDSARGFAWHTFGVYLIMGAIAFAFLWGVWKWPRAIWRAIVDSGKAIGAESVSRGTAIRGQTTKRVASFKELPNEQRLLYLGLGIPIAILVLFCLWFFVLQNLDAGNWATLGKFTLWTLIVAVVAWMIWTWPKQISGAIVSAMATVFKEVTGRRDPVEAPAESEPEPSGDLGEELVPIGLVSQPKPAFNAPPALNAPPAFNAPPDAPAFVPPPPPEPLPLAPPPEKPITAARPARAPVAPPPPAAPAPVKEVAPCANCGRTIGRLEPEHLWKEHRVCSDCIEILSKKTKVPRY